MAVLVRSNLFNRDVRLPKVMKALRQEGYATTLMCWDREINDDKPSTSQKHKEIRLRLKAPWGIKVLPFLPVWWCFVLIRLLILRWDVTHAVNLDCIIPTVIAGLLKRKPVIYEILDVYEGRLPKTAMNICLWFDKLFMRLANAIIIVDEAQNEGIGGIPNRNIVPIYDSPPDTSSQGESGYPSNQPVGDFTLFYAGVLYRNRRLNLDKVFEAIKEIEGAKSVIAGYGDLVGEIEELSRQMPSKVEFIGEISYQEVISRGAKADLFFVLRDSTVPTHRYTCGSTLFNAMVCGKPVLANKGSSTAAKVLEENCGLVVDANNILKIREAIVKLKENPELCRELGANARKAYEQKYSWEIMEQRLLALYQKLAESGKDEDD
ncbi:glycosyltransferase family 4 protein [Chloroflexota bacterium]